VSFLSNEFRYIAYASAAAFLVAAPAAVQAEAGRCASAPQCRHAPPAGNLRFGPNGAGTNIWTSPCGPNSNPSSPDLICTKIAACTTSGGFGKFLKAVTGQCTQKHFSGYFGLDGLTFGILDWTSQNLPGVLQAYQSRSSQSYQQTLGPLNLPMRDGCLDPSWVCRANQQAALMCDANFRSHFSSALATPEFRKAQMDYALFQYEERVQRYAEFGFRSEHGAVVMAVLGNNLRSTDACKPNTWRQVCRGSADEKALVNCVLQQYLVNDCRGSHRGTLSRVAALHAVLGDDWQSTNIHPAAQAIEACVPDWNP
jgi:hypothetical protein